MRPALISVASAITAAAPKAADAVVPQAVSLLQTFPFDRINLTYGDFLTIGAGLTAIVSGVYGIVRR